MFASSCTEEDSRNTVTDIDGNTYTTVKIGTQVWMAENLKTTKYNDGTPIPYSIKMSDWAALSTPGYCFYDNDAANKYVYGALYNWYSVNTGKLAPSGWHVPTDDEWTTLENYLIANGYNYDGTTTGNKIAKSLAATAGWSNTSPYTGDIGHDPKKNNTSGFAALPGGSCGDIGFFGGISTRGIWWSSTEDNNDGAYTRTLGDYGSDLSEGPRDKHYGFSVRCIRDN